MPGLPPRLVEAIEKLMATNPDDRYQTADEAAAALRTLLRPKNVPQPSGSASTEAAITSVPEPVPNGDTTLKAPAPPVRSGIRLSKLKWDSLRTRMAGRGTKANRVLVAVAAVALILVTITLFMFRSSKDERPAIPQEAVPANNAAMIPAARADVPQASVAIENPKQGPTIVMKKDVAGANLPPAGANARQSSLVIEFPTQGATVRMREELTGRIESEGWPVIFVQADIPGQPWWCQAAIEKVDGKRFSTKIVFGDDSTPHGMRFRIAGIVARTREEALKFPIGSKHYALPDGFPHSVEVAVTHQ